MKFEMKKYMMTICIVGVLLICIALCTLLFFGQPNIVAAEESVTWDNNVYTEAEAFLFTPLSDSKCSAKLTDKSKVNVRVPKIAVIDGKQYAVTDIASNGFASAEELKTIIMPSVKNIGNSAFQNCKNLELAYAPKLESVGMGAFMKCPNLFNIIFPSTLKSVSASVFTGNNTVVHARFDETPSAWSARWNAGNKVQDVDFNGKDENGQLWKHGFIYDTNNIQSRTSSNAVTKRLAPLQPFMENESQGHLIITDEFTDIESCAFIDSTFDSIKILWSETPINIQTSAFSALTVIEGFTIDREVTYYDFGDSESIMPYNEINTPFITLPVPDKILVGMFVGCTVENINFRTADGITYEDKGVVKIPNGIDYIGEAAFDGVKGVRHLYIPFGVTQIEKQAFAKWNTDQTIHTPFVSELHADGLLTHVWREECGALIEYLGELYIVSQPDVITDKSVNIIEFEFKLQKDAYTLNDFSYKRPYTYWNKDVFKEVFDYTVAQTDTETEDYLIHKWTYSMRVKDSSIGGCAFEQIIQVYLDDILVLEKNSEKTIVNNLVASADDFYEFYDCLFEKYTDYEIDLTEDINLGKFTDMTDRGWGFALAGSNKFVLNGKGHTIFYEIEIDKILAGESGKFSLFNENRNIIENLNVNCKINLKNADMQKVSSTTTKYGSANVAGVAYDNVDGAVIENCIVNIDAYVNAYLSEVGGVVVYNNGLISHCTVSGNIEGTDKYSGVDIGGIAFWNYSETAEITGCTNKANIFGYGNLGGGAVQNNGRINSCKNDGKITYKYAKIEEGRTTYRSVAGIVAMNLGDCTESKNAGTIKFGGNISSDVYIQPVMGQIIGTQYSGALFGNTWTGNVDTAGLSSDYHGFNQTLYARNAECGKI